MIPIRFTTSLLACAVAAFPLPGASANETENLLIITYDGLRYQEVFQGLDDRLLDPELKAASNIGELKERFGGDTPQSRRAKLLPFFWGTIAEHGQVYGDASRGSESIVTNGLYFSYPGYNEILCGKADARVNSNARTPNPNVTVLEWLNNKPEFKGRVAAFGSWDVFPYIINTGRSGIPVNAGWDELTESPDPKRLTFLNEMAHEVPHVWGGVRYDVFTFYAALEYIQKHKPRVIYIAFGETDDWAHDRDYDLYIDAAWRTDRYIRRLWETLQAMAQYNGKTSLIMTTDHGRGDTGEDWTSHGTGIPHADRIWIAVMGPDTPALGIVENSSTRQDQVAATATALLGLEYDLEGAGEAIRDAVRTATPSK